MTELVSRFDELAVLRQQAKPEQDQIEECLREMLAKVQPHIDNLRPLETRATELALESVYFLDQWLENNGFRDEEIDEDLLDKFDFSVPIERITETAKGIGLSEDESWKLIYSYMEIIAVDTEKGPALFIEPEEFLFEQVAEQEWGGGYHLHGKRSSFDIELCLNPESKNRKEMASVDIKLPFDALDLMRMSKEANENHSNNKNFISRLPTCDTATISYAITETARYVLLEQTPQE
jgi:hypothetical protein